jgi:peptidyl-tRNA hydrolase, PTH1 family
LNLLVGLGNPGSKYEGTRHNIGFMVAERVAQCNGVPLKKKGYQGLYGVGRVSSRETAILLPQTFMNCSGVSVKAATQSLGIVPGDLIVIYDDLDLSFGRLRIKKDGGHGGHNGIRDIVALLGYRDFVRLRIGIGRPDHGNITAHVLNRFNPDEQKVLPRLLDDAVNAAEKIMTDGAIEAMNSFNGYNLYDEL